MTRLRAETFLVAAGATRVSPDVVELIESFASLPAGWHFGEGVAAERSTIDCAAKIAVIAATKGWEMEAFPGIAGDVTIACYRDEFELEIIVTASGGYAFASSVDDIRVERDLDASLAELLDRIAFLDHAIHTALTSTSLKSQEIQVFRSCLPKFSTAWNFRHPVSLRRRKRTRVDLRSRRKLLQHTAIPDSLLGF